MKYTASYRLLNEDRKPISTPHRVTVNFDNLPRTENEIINALQRWIAHLNTGTEFTYIELLEVN